MHRHASHAALPIIRAQPGLREADGLISGVRNTHSSLSGEPGGGGGSMADSASPRRAAAAKEVQEGRLRRPGDSAAADHSRRLFSLEEDEDEYANDEEAG